MENESFELPIAAVKRIIKVEVGSDVPVSKDAAIALLKEAEELIKSRAKQAYTLSQHAKRKSIREEDVTASR